MSEDEYFIDELKKIKNLAEAKELIFGYRTEGDKFLFFVKNNKQLEFSLKFPSSPGMEADYNNQEDIISTMGILIFKMDYDKIKATEILGKDLLFELLELGEKINYIAKGTAIT